MQSSGTDEEMVFEVFPCDRWPFRGKAGVDGLLDVYTDSVSVSREGMDSLEQDRRPRAVLSLSTLDVSSSISCGGLNSNLHECGLKSDRAGPLRLL